MKKTSLYIERDVDAGLTLMASRQRIAKAELIRRVLRDAVNGGAHQPRLSVGVFEGPAGLARNVDHHLAETRFGAD